MDSDLTRIISPLMLLLHTQLVAATQGQRILNLDIEFVADY